MNIVADIEQGTEEWKQLRLGKVTASRVADVVARTKTGWGASRANYAAELIAERLTGTAAERFTNDAMRWGSETEHLARLAYEFHADTEVTQVAFAYHPTIPMAGASPDGLVGHDGLVEIKCPNTATHIETLLGGSIPGKYEAQCQWQMACTGRHWVDWVSFDPRLPEDMRLFVQRIARDDEAIASLEIEVAGFLVEIATKIDALVRAVAQRRAA
jgi:putative phage-type endonuclease